MLLVATGGKMSDIHCTVHWYLLIKHLKHNCSVSYKLAMWIRLSSPQLP